MSNRIEETLLFKNLDKWEANFIESVRLYLNDTQPKVFSFRYFDYYIGIKTKDDSGFPYSFKKPKDVLVFRYVSKSSKKVSDFEISAPSENNLSWVILTITNNQRVAIEKPVVKKERASYQTRRFLGRLSDEQLDFVMRFKKEMRAKFSKTLRFKNKTSKIDVVTYKGSETLFIFKLVNGMLTFQNKVNDYELVITENDKASLASVLNCAINTLKQNKNDDVQALETKKEEKPLPFSDTLNTEEKAFVASFAKIVKEYYQGNFDPCIGETFISFKEKRSDRALFWFCRKGGELCFEAHPKNDDVKSVLVGQKNKETLISILGIVKKACDSYGLLSKNQEKPKQVEVEKKVIPTSRDTVAKSAPTVIRSTAKIYSFIRDEFRNKAYNALPSFRALCRSIKTYFLDVVNKDRKVKFTNAAEACESALFFKNSISWTDKAWSNSAKIVYSYFKANTLVEKIQYYEEIKQLRMFDDYDALLQYFYSCIYGNMQIDYSKAPSMTKDFASLSTEPLKEILENFESYEQE